MAAPLTVKRNNYKKNRKDNTHETPLPLAEWLCNILDEATGEMVQVVLDPCCGGGNLLRPWRRKQGVVETVGFDTSFYFGDEISRFFYFNFLEQEIDSFQIKFVPDLILCNPPFNQTSGDRRLLPEVFLLKIFELFGEETPVALFTPMGFCLNQRKKSKRYQYFRDICRAELTGRIALPLDIFPGVEFHQEILLWNLPGARPHYWVPKEVVEKLV